MSEQSRQPGAISGSSVIQDKTAIPTTASSATVRAEIQQAYDLHLSVNIVPTRDIPVILTRACRPRQGGQRVEKDPLDLPESTRKWLLDADKLVMSWLASSSENQKAFAADPMSALQKAGVKIDRTHLKTLTRVRENFGTAGAVVPGLQLRSVKIMTDTKGRIKPPESTSNNNNWAPPAAMAFDSSNAAHGKDCNCGCQDRGGRDEEKKNVSRKGGQ